MRRLKSAIAVVIALGLLTGAAWVADRWARSEIEQRVEAGIVEQVPELQGTVEAELGGRFAIPQLIAGTLEEMTITSSDAVIDGLALSDVEIVATGIPVRGDGTIATVHATGTAPLATVLTAVERRVTLPEGMTLELRDGEIAAVASVLGVPLEAHVVLVPQPRSLVVDVERLVLGGATVSVEDLPFDLGGLLGTVVSLDALPPAVELEDIVVAPDGVEVTLTGTDVAL